MHILRTACDLLKTKYLLSSSKYLSSFFNDLETDAVHHRLAGESPAIEKNYQCYNCNQSFCSLVDLGNHSQNLPWHSVEICLNCTDPITVFVQKFPFKVVRLHTCKRSHLRYQNSDLHLLSIQISKILCWNEKTQHQSVIFCDTCNELFSQTPLGLFEFLVHSNLTAHNVIPSSHCKKCTMPEFKLTGSNLECCIAHFCTKDSNSILKELQKNVQKIEKHSQTKK
jgi:hypothetical protein